LYGRGGGRGWLTTVAVTLFRDGTLSVVSVGDSPVFLIRADTCQPLYSPLSGFGLGGRVRALGDCVILATDGVSANVTCSELVEMVRSAKAPDEAAERLNALLEAQLAAHPRPAPTGREFRRDDWTAIVRFFGR
jgi:serine/threonine protein phosphatase PrpC